MIFEVSLVFKEIYFQCYIELPSILEYNSMKKYVDTNFYMDTVLHITSNLTKSNFFFYILSHIETFVVSFSNSGVLINVFISTLKM